MIRATLPDFEIVGDIDAPLPDAAVEAIAVLLLDAVDARGDRDCHYEDRGR